MIEDKKLLAIIPARGGSKGIPKKNIKILAGKPLIAWTIEEAKKSQYIDRLILSSDDTEIIHTAKQYDCDVPYIRPSELAQDDTPGIDPVLHALNTLPEKYAYVVVLQPTSPLRTVEDIDGCIEYCINKNANACVSVSEPAKSPYWSFSISDSGTLVPLIDTGGIIPCRQDLPKVYALNGAVYVARVSWLKDNKTFITRETIGYVMNKERSFDIDDEVDFRIVEYLITSQPLQ